MEFFTKCFEWLVVAPLLLIVAACVWGALVLLVRAALEQLAEWLGRGS